jgi:hypothetical protein
MILKKIYFYLLILLVFNIIISSCENINNKPIEMWINAKSGLNLRESSTTNSDIIDTIPFKERVIIIDKDKLITEIDGLVNTWYKVEWNSKKGWVFGAYLSLYKDYVDYDIAERTRLGKIKNIFLIADLIPSMKEDDVKKIHGRPNKIEKDLADQTGNSEYWFYDGFIIRFLKERIVDIKLTSNKYKTTRGITIGDDLNILCERYSKLYKHDWKYGVFNEYCLYDYSIWIKQDDSFCEDCILHLKFLLKNNKILEIISKIECCPGGYS